MFESTNDFVLQEDLEWIVSKCDQFSSLKDSTVLITGATGLIGSLLVRTIACFNRMYSADIHILALVRNIPKANRMFGELIKRGDVEVLEADISKDIGKSMLHIKNINYIIHAASVTASKVMITKPVETIQTALNGTQNILELAKEKKCQSMVYISSMEVYGSINKKDDLVKEDDIGYLNPLVLRSNYPESKRMCENMCIAYMNEYQVPVKIARLAQTFGAGILPGENRVFAQFARSVEKQQNIVLHTKGLSEGNYCYTRDVVYAILLLLEHGKNGEAYNIANEESHTTIANMAQMVCSKIAEDKIKVIFDIPEQNIYGYAADTKMKLDTSKIQLLGWKAEIGLEEAYRRMMKSMSLTGV